MDGPGAISRPDPPDRHRVNLPCAARVLIGALISPVPLRVRKEEAATGLSMVHCQLPGKKCDREEL